MNITQQVELIQQAIEAIEAKQLAKLGLPECQRKPIYQDFKNGKLRIQSLTMVVNRLDRANYRALQDRRLDRPEFKQSLIGALLSTGVAIRVCTKKEQYASQYEIRVAGQLGGAQLHLPSKN